MRDMWLGTSMIGFRTIVHSFAFAIPFVSNRVPTSGVNIAESITFSWTMGHALTKKGETAGRRADPSGQDLRSLRGGTPKSTPR